MFNEHGNIGTLHARLRDVLTRLSDDSEIILVDDGSVDGTWEAIVALVHEVQPSATGVAAQPVVKGCRLSRNFGHQAALLAGLHTARGDVIVTMDGDLQHPPEVIAELLAQWQDGYDIVGTQRLDTSVASPFKRVTSRWFYRLFSLLAEVELKEGSSDFRLLDRRVLRTILDMRDTALFLRGTVEWVGFRKTVIPYQVAARQHGESKYNLLRMFRFAGSAVVSHSTMPLRMGVWLGLVTSVLACLEIFYVLGMAIAGETVPGWASTLLIQSFFFGILFILMGIVGIYLANIYRLLQARPNFIIADTFGSQPTARRDTAAERGADR